MSPPRFLVSNLPASGRLSLDEAEARHASSVLRLGIGDAVVLFDGVGGEAMATVDEAHKRSLIVAIVNRTDTDRELPGGLEMLVALPKGDRQRTLIDGLVQYGVTKLTALETQRGVAELSANALQRLERAVVETSKQCGRNVLMSIGAAISIGELAAQETQLDMLKLIAHPYGDTTPLSGIARQACARVAVGPEGGFTDDECQTLSQAGWTPVRLGPRILRIEFASMFVAAWWASR